MDGLKKKRTNENYDTDHRNYYQVGERDKFNIIKSLKLARTDESFRIYDVSTSIRVISDAERHEVLFNINDLQDYTKLV